MVETENRTKSKTNEMASYGGEFESYLISALNDSLLKKSKSTPNQTSTRMPNEVTLWIRSNKEFAVHKLVDWKRWEEPHHSRLLAWWQSPRDYHQRHKVLRQRTLLCWQEEHNATSRKLNQLKIIMYVLVLGFIRWGASWHLWQINCAQAVWSQDSRME